MTLAIGKNLYFLPRYLGGKPFLILYIVANNRLLLTTTNALVNTGANSYLFISLRFSKKIAKLLEA